MIAYTPDELVGIANQEFAWCDREMLRATKELGFGADWKKALEAVKNKYVEPGQMIYLVRDLSREAIEYLEKRELVTIPPMLKEDYWEEAMTPQMQLVNPFFTGGATIQVSSPASTQSYAERMEALRGNNMFFARATVFHELVPGHHMQQYMTQRYRELPIDLRHGVLDGGAGVLLGDAVVEPGIHAIPPSSGSERCSGGCTAAPESFSR